MSSRSRVVFFVLMSLALAFGFMHHLSVSGARFNFERLHIFLFNLCSGGTILLYYTEGKSRFSRQVLLFLGLAIAYALLAFFKLYIPAMVVALVMAGLVEQVREARFPRVPVDLFRMATPVAVKFHHAALLCLVLALLSSSAVILNNQYLHLISLPKLQLDTFFLGFSFPISLITMSVIFSRMKHTATRLFSWLESFSFWSVNLGVITFFLFILAEKFWPQVLVTLILFATVFLIYCLYRQEGIESQEKNFLTSGMFFLLFTAVTGILYIFLESWPEYTLAERHLLLRTHAFAALYGWNLMGLTVIFREQDFPIHLKSPTLILLHWVTVIIFAPLGYVYLPFALLATACYAQILYAILFSRPSFK